MIFCDIDGCLNSGRHVPFDLKVLAEIRDWLAKLPENGPQMILTTGRPQPYVEAMAQILGLKTPMIFEGGSGIFDPLTDKVRVLSDPATKVRFDILAAKLRDFARGIEGIEPEIGKVFSISLSGPAMAEDYDKVARLTQELIAQFGEADAEWSHSATTVDVAMPGINKWTACQVLIQDAGITTQDCAAIGDSNGDMPMLTKVGLPMCPANAAAAVQSVSKFIATAPYAAGTFECLKDSAATLAADT